MRVRDVVSIGLFPVCFLILTITERSIYPVLLMLAVFLHECGHLLCAALCGAGIRGVRAQCFGLMFIFDMHLISYKKEVLILLSGAAANMFVAALAFSLLPHTREVIFFCGASLALGIFNLLPFSRSDGGQALLCTFRAKSPAGDTPSSIRIIFGFFTLMLWFISVYIQFYYGGNLSILILSIYILLEFILSPKVYVLK